MRTSIRPRNDPDQYDDLAGEWWAPRGAFAPLHWLAAARAELIAPARRPDSLLLDLACGGGLLAPHLADSGHRHVGVDIGACAVAIARDHGVESVRADVAALPFPAERFDVVVAGEIFEHVVDLEATVAEIGRVLRPGGLLVCDTLAATRRCAFVLVTLGERLGVAPRGIHDPALFVDPARLQAACAAAGITLEVRGVRPRLDELGGWLLRRREQVRMRVTRSTGFVYQGVGVKAL